MILCASALRPPDSVGDEPLVRLAAAAGCAGISIDRGCTLAGAAPLARRSLHAGLAVAAIAAPLPERALAAGRRLPSLSAAERDEREAATALATQALALAGSLGTPVVSLDMGPLALAVRAAEVARFFQRRELDEGEAGATQLAAALDERRARVGPRLDACRFALDALAREAERRGVALALQLASTPWGLPTPREGLTMLADYEGARIGVVFDPARLSVMRHLGLSIAPQRLSALRKHARLVAHNEAVGIEAGFLPGLGERQDDLAARDDVPAASPILLVGRPDSTDAEVLAAVGGAA
jgi:sugar phosphate isomerase/epimerase